jgi:hypothetical protein
MTIKQPKRRNLIAMDLRQNKLYAPKTVAPKRGKGVAYKRDKRAAERGGSAEITL